jgi:hypothetical protein
MAAPCYIIWNGVTTALSGTTILAPTASAATVTPKTILQIQNTKKMRIVEWGYILAATPVAPVTFELIETGAIAATVTTLASSATAYNDVGASTSSVTYGTSATGFNASLEGTITATRLLAETYDTAAYFKQQFPLGREPEITATNNLRVRVTPSTAVAVSVLCYVIWEE